jgi:ribosomal protein S27AE
MANRECPKCGAHFPVTDDWAKGSVSLLIAAPAVPDMATQVRCPNCDHVFADSEVRYPGSSAPRGLMMFLALLVALLIWAVY